MSTIAVYTLEDFVKDLRQAFAKQEDLVGRANSVAVVLQHLLKVGGWVQALLDKGGYEALPGSTYVDDRSDRGSTTARTTTALAGWSTGRIRAPSSRPVGGGTTPRACSNRGW